jgi:hypothetical protein
MSEPNYLRQHGAFADLTPDERWNWFQAAAAEAKGEGITWARYSVDDNENPTRALVEGWKVQPDDQGPIRWQMTEAKP